MPDQTNPIALRTPTRETFREFLVPAMIAFGEVWTDDEITIEADMVEFDRMVGAFDGSLAVGVSGAFTFRMTTPGGEVGAAGVTLVGVLPTHRRRGILRQMMTELYRQATERGEPVAILWASEGAIYQRFGFGMATKGANFEAVKGKIVFSNPIEPEGRVRLVERDEFIELARPVYEARRPTLNGSISRDDVRWRLGIAHDADWMQYGRGHKVLAVYEVDGKARGYAIHRRKGDWQQTGPQHIVTVFEVLGLDPAAEQVLWQWLFSLDLVETVACWRAPEPNPLLLMITEPRRLNMSVADAIYLRIIDLKGALEGRRYRGPGSVVFDVTDADMPANAGRWRLTVAADGAGELTAASAAEAVDLVVDVRDLASVYLGAYRFGDLASAGRVRECRPGALADADALFATSTAPWNSTMF